MRFSRLFRDDDPRFFERGGDLRKALAFWSFAFCAGCALCVSALVSGNDIWAALLGFVALSMLERAWRSAVQFQKPQRYQLDLAQVAVLSSGDLTVLEACLTINEEKESDADITETGLCRELRILAWRALPEEEFFSSPDWSPLALEELNSVTALIRAGLLEDRRARRGEKELLVVPMEIARTVLEDERERRERIAPVGWRQRPSALSA
jgi:hypothetical protein